MKSAGKRQSERKRRNKCDGPRRTQKKTVENPLIRPNVQNLENASN